MADIEGSEYTRLSCSELDRLPRLARFCGDWQSGGGKGGLEQGDLTPLQSVGSKGVCACEYICTVFVVKCIVMNAHGCVFSVYAFLYH